VDSVEPGTTYLKAEFAESVDTVNQPCALT